MSAFSRKSILAAALFTTLLAPSFAQARNLEVESSLRQLGDVSDFYHALIYTGVANELNEGQGYTILAPTNAAFTIINRQSYPCFYTSQCREQAASFVRAHIIPGHHSLPMMVRHVRLETDARNQVVIEEPYVNQYTANGQDILSTTDAGHSVIYRINGLLVDQRNLGVFQSVGYRPNGAVLQTTTTYVVPNQDVIDAQQDPAILPGVNAETTTVQKTTTVTTGGYQPSEDWQ